MKAALDSLISQVKEETKRVNSLSNIDADVALSSIDPNLVSRSGQFPDHAGSGPNGGLEDDGSVFSRVAALFLGRK